MVAKVKYLNNKDLLKQIHLSKMSFCWIKSPQYDYPDIIINAEDDITDEVILDAKKNKAGKMKDFAYQQAVAGYEGPANKKPRQKDFLVDPEDIADEDVVVRKMTYEHIPLEPG